MKFTKQEDYAVILMAELAKAGADKYQSLGKISKDYEVSRLFLKNIAIKLKAAGLIKSREGVAGGYLLSRPANKINLLEIISALGQIDVLDCQACKREAYCNSAGTWTKLIENFLESLKKTKLSKVNANRQDFSKNY